LPAWACLVKISQPEILSFVPVSEELKFKAQFLFHQQDLMRPKVRLTALSYSTFWRPLNLSIVFPEAKKGGAAELMKLSQHYFCPLKGQDTITTTEKG